METRAWKEIEMQFADELESRPCLNFGGVFFCFAAKAGGSEIFHCDTNDGGTTMTLVTPFGQFEGGELETPQLKTKTPVQRLQVIGTQTKSICHRTSGIGGDMSRIAFTFFVHQNDLDKCAYSKLQRENSTA